jgi:hypothetical protein
MDDEKINPACVQHGLNMLHRWINELEGHNRHKAFELLNTVMDGSLTNEEAFALLECN